MRKQWPYHIVELARAVYSGEPAEAPLSDALKEFGDAGNLPESED